MIGGLTIEGRKSQSSTIVETINRTLSVSRAGEGWASTLLVPAARQLGGGLNGLGFFGLRALADIGQGFLRKTGSVAGVLYGSKRPGRDDASGLFRTHAIEGDQLLFGCGIQGYHGVNAGPDRAGAADVLGATRMAKAVTLLDGGTLQRALLRFGQAALQLAGALADQLIVFVAAFGQQQKANSDTQS